METQSQKTPQIKKAKHSIDEIAKEIRAISEKLAYISGLLQGMNDFIHGKNRPNTGP